MKKIFFLTLLFCVRLYATQFICGGDATCNDQTMCPALLKLFKAESVKSSWRFRHHSLGQKYNELNCTKVIEIGIARAELSTYFLENCPQIVEYNAIDPFLGGYDNANDAMSQILSATNDSKAWKDAILTKMKQFGCRFRLYNGLSQDMVNNFQPQSIDCIFIDGDHRYEGVKADIRNYGPILKQGGALIFDDYRTADFPGVVQAVDELVAENGLTLESINSRGNSFVKTKVGVELKV